MWTLPFCPSGWQRWVWLGAFQEKRKVLLAVLSNLEIWKCTRKNHWGEKGGGKKEKRKKAKGKRGRKQGHSVAENWPVLVSPEDCGEASRSQGGIRCCWLWVVTSVNWRQPIAGIEKDTFRLKIVQSKIPMKVASSSHIWRRKEKEEEEGEGEEWEGEGEEEEWVKLSDSPARLLLLLWPAFKHRDA